MTNYPPAFISPLVLDNGFEVKNRFFKSAMSEQLGDKNQNPTYGLVNLYRTWAEGGVGLMMTGNVMVDRAFLGEPKNVVLDRQSDLSIFREWAKAGHQHDCKLWMQLNHPGKQIPAFLNLNPVAPSAIPIGHGLGKAFALPRALGHAEIEDIISRFAVAAALAKETGFSGVQIHGAHGYLVSQFLSPRHNKRTDQWGGSRDNRLRFVMRLYEAIREAVGQQFPIGIKLNSTDFLKDGFSESDSMHVIQALSDAGINLVEISGGTYENPVMMRGQRRSSTIKREAYFLDFAEKAKAHCKATLVVTGGFRTAQGMDEAISSGATDMVGLARPFAVEPALVKHIGQRLDYVVDAERTSTGINTLDKLTVLDINWYETQLRRLARGKKANKRLNAWRAVWSVLLATGIQSFKRRRAPSSH